MIEIGITTIAKEECSIKVARYSNGRIALKAFSVEDGLPYATLSVNLINEDVGPNEVYLDVNNNPTIIQDLLKANIVTSTFYWKKSGYVDYPKARVREWIMKKL